VFVYREALDELIRDVDAAAQAMWDRVERQADGFVKLRLSASKAACSTAPHGVRSAPKPSAALIASCENVARQVPASMLVRCSRKPCRCIPVTTSPTPRRAVESERLLVGNAVSEDLARAAGKAAVDGATPLSKNAYKVPVLETIVRRTILVAALSAITRELKTADLLERLRAADVPSAPVPSPAISLRTDRRLTCLTLRG